MSFPSDLSELAAEAGSRQPHQYAAKGDLLGTTYVLWQVRKGRFDQLD